MDRSAENRLALEIDELVTDRLLARIVDRVYRLHGNTKTAQMMDRIKDLGFMYSTLGAITVSVSDIVVPKEKSGSSPGPRNRYSVSRRRSAKG